MVHTSISQVRSQPNVLLPLQNDICGSYMKRLQKEQRPRSFSLRA